MSGTFRVSVSKDYLAFSSAHFITFRGHRCEALHGHNYRVGVLVEGAVDPECHFVLDFGVLKAIVRPLVEAVDHRVLLPTRSDKLALEEQAGRLTVIYAGEPRYVFPRGDCALLPIANSTAEMLAEYFAREIAAKLPGQGSESLHALEVEVEESEGQSATYRMDLPGR